MELEWTGKCIEIESNIDWKWILFVQSLYWLPNALHIFMDSYKNIDSSLLIVAPLKLKWPKLKKCIMQEVHSSEKIIADLGLHIYTHLFKYHKTSSSCLHLTKIGWQSFLKMDLSQKTNQKWMREKTANKQQKSKI